MENRIEKLIAIAYKRWKADQADKMHPDEETMVCFLENRLSQEESEGAKLHLAKCQRCSEILVAQIKLGNLKEGPVPEDLLIKAKELVGNEYIDTGGILGLVLRFKKDAIELLDTVGDVLVGQELIPAPVLRSRKIKDFKDEVTILKDFKDMRVEIKVENKQAKAFNLIVIARQKGTQRITKDLRISLIKDDAELESYLAESGKVVFEHILIGKYTIEISNLGGKVASILLDIRV